MTTSSLRRRDARGRLLPSGSPRRKHRHKISLTPDEQRALRYYAARKKTSIAGVLLSLASAGIQAIVNGDDPMK